METNNIDERILELTKKADAAQKAGNYELMKEIDSQIRELQNAKWELFKKAAHEIEKPRVR